MIELQHLTKRYSDHGRSDHGCSDHGRSDHGRSDHGRARLAVDDVTVTIRPGRVTALLGPNGAGKSTTLRMLLGLTRPTSGRALVTGRRYRDLPAPLTTVGAVLDAGAVHPGRPAGAHLRGLARSNGLPSVRVDEVLATVGLIDVAGRRVGSFSLGMRQRLGIASALLGDPHVVRAVRTVAAGSALLDPAVTARVVEAFTRSASPVPLDERRLGVLTARERDVVTLVGRGCSNDDIARALVISPLTAKTHVNRAMAKLGARDRAQLVIVAYETGLVRVQG